MSKSIDGKSIAIIFVKNYYKESYSGTMYIRTIVHSKVRRLSLGIKVSEEFHKEHFNLQTERFNVNRSKIKSSVLFNQLKEYNVIIERELSKLRAVRNELSDLPDEKKSFIEYCERKIKNLKPGTKLRYESSIAKTKGYLKTIGKQDLLFSSITPQFIDELKHHFTTSITENNKKLGQNGVNFYLKVLKSFLKSAIEEDYYHYNKNPFRTLKFSNIRISRPVLSEDDIKKLIETPINEVYNGIPLSSFRDMFLFQFFANGMRVGDAITLTWGNIKGGRIIYKMSKNSKPFEVPLNLNLYLIISRMIQKEGLFDYCKSRLKIDMVKKGSGFAADRNSTVSLQQIDKLIERAEYIPDELTMFKTYKRNPDLDFADLEIRRETMGEIVDYKGYKVHYKHDYKKQLIDTRENLVKKINTHFIRLMNTEIEIIKKTDNEAVLFPLFPSRSRGKIIADEQKRILAEYRIIGSKTTTFNKRLLRIQELCKINPAISMSSHSQRHTVANLLLKMDVSMYNIKETLNHSSVNTTQIYFHKGTGFDKSDSSNALIDKLF